MFSSQLLHNSVCLHCGIRVTSTNVSSTIYIVKAGSMLNWQSHVYVTFCVQNILMAISNFPSQVTSME